MAEKVDATEKITININTTDLGYIDVLVSEGYYATRTEFIKTAIKRQLDSHGGELRQLLERKRPSGGNDELHWVVGVTSLTKPELMAVKKKGKKLGVTVVGLLSIDKDIPMELLEETVGVIKVYGAVRCPKEVKERYGL